MVVDDERAIADLIEVYLLNEGYRVFKFYSGREALSCLETEKLDLAVLDVMLPDIDGFSICRSIRKNTISQSSCSPRRAKKPIRSMA